MDRPDPRDQAAMLAYLADKIDAIEARLFADRSERLSMTAAARALRMDPNFFYGKPWRWPTFGLEYMRRYPEDEWRAWLKRPEAERRAEWDRLPADKRRLAMGMASKRKLALGATA